MVLAVVPDWPREVAGRLEAAGEAVVRIGEVIEGPRGCTVRGAAGTWSAREDWSATHECLTRQARVAVMLSGNGTTMSSLLFHSRLPDCPYEIVLVASNQPEARGLKIAEAEGIATFAHSHRGMAREAHEAIMDARCARPAPSTSRCAATCAC
jgi:hypothetical protein